MNPVSLNMIDVALMTSISDGSITGKFESPTHDKAVISEKALGKLCDPEVQLPEATFRLNRLIDLNLIVSYGSGFIVTPKGAEALTAMKSRMQRLVTNLRGV